MDKVRAQGRMGLPIVADIYLNKARTDDAMDGQMVACSFVGVIPAIGTPLALGCIAATFMEKTTVRMVGYCARYTITIANPKHPRISWCKGGFCT